MRADDDIHLVTGDTLIYLLMLFRRQMAGEETHADPRPGQLTGKRFVMLTRENLCRCHQGSLEAILHSLDERQQGENGLSRADIPLHEPPHGHWPLHIAADLPPDRGLIVGQRKWQSLGNLLAEPPRSEMAHPSLRFPSFSFEEQQTALDEIELLERQPFPRRRERRRILREMDG